MVWRSGHTDLVLMKDHGVYDYLGGTRDDASGECFDKCARLLNLPYPGGPNLSKLAQSGNPKAFNLPRPMWDSKDYDFSFSGLKTAVSNLITPSFPRKREPRTDWIPDQVRDDKWRADLAASIEQAIVDILIKKLVTAVKEYNIEQVLLAGGVASNRRLRELTTHTLNCQVYIPEPSLCTDNAVTTATCALFMGVRVDPLTLQANPNLSLSHRN